MCAVTGVPGHSYVYTSVPVCDRLLTLLSINRPGTPLFRLPGLRAQIKARLSPTTRPNSHTHIHTRRSRTLWIHINEEHHTSHGNKKAPEHLSERKSFSPSPHHIIRQHLILHTHGFLHRIPNNYTQLDNLNCPSAPQGEQ